MGEGNGNHSSFLPEESQGRGSLVGCHLWGGTESDTTEAAAAAALKELRPSLPQNVALLLVVSLPKVISHEPSYFAA